MEPRTIGSYGGPKLDALPVSNPESQVAASEMNRYMEDVAQATRTVLRASVRFLADATVPATDPLPPAAVSHRSVWGNGVAQKPVVVRDGVGLYTVTYASTFTDPLGVTESVAFFGGQVSLSSAASADDFSGRILTIAANVASIVVKDAGALADVGEITVWLL